jgi:tetratricopeptide (TPR) repeat protein
MRAEAMVRTVLVAILAVAVCSCASTGAVPAPGRAASAGSDALALVAQAQLRLEAGEISAGLRLFADAVALAPGDDELREEYGLALAGVGLTEGAVEQLTKPARLSPAGEATLGILLSQAATDPAAVAAALPHLEAGVDAVPQGMQARLTLAQSLLRLGRGADAWPHVQVLLSERPEDPRIQLLAGQSMRQAGRLDEAAGYLRQAASNADVRPRATIELVEALAAGGKHREAADLMGEFIRTEGSTVAALARWATLLVRAGDRERANQVLDGILEKDPGFRDALLLKAMLAAGAGDVQGAEQLYRRVLAGDAADPDAALGLARLLVELRRLDEARTLLAGVWARVVEGKLESDEAGVEVAQELAAVELVDEKPDAALPWLRRLDVLPLSRRSLALWAGHFRLRKANREGIDYFVAAKVGEDPGAERARSAFEAEFRLAAGEEDAALRLLEPLLAGDEDEVLAALGTLERAKRYAQVVELSRQALARLPEARGVRFALAASLERSDRWEESEKQFLEILVVQPDDAPSLNYLGYMYADRGVKLEEAREMLLKAVSLDPTSGAYIDSLGWVYFRLGEYGLAEKHLTEAARLAPSDPTVNEHMGDLFRALGDAARAAEWYRRALACEADDPEQPAKIREKLATVETTGADAPR